jgi:DNA-binding Lrp family transcriptional regulator
MTIDIEILQFLHYNPLSSRSEISDGISNPPSAATLKRIITEAVGNGNIVIGAEQMYHPYHFQMYRL